MTTWADDAAAALDDLGDSPTPVQARAVTDRYPNVDVLAALASRGGGGGQVQVATRHVTAVEINDTLTTGDPIELVPAPDSADSFTWFDYALLVYRPGTVAWDFDPPFKVRWDTFPSTDISFTEVLRLNLLETTGYLGVLAQTFQIIPDGAASVTPQGQSVVLFCPNPGTGEEGWGEGDGTIDATIHYREFSLAVVA